MSWGEGFATTEKAGEESVLTSATNLLVTFYVIITFFCTEQHGRKQE